MKTLLGFHVLALAIGVGAPAAPAQVLNASNGHWYEGVLMGSPITWDSANALATGSTFMGMPGHLATISDQNENNFVDSTSPHRMWIGGFQDTADPNFSEPAGGWKWVTGEVMAYTNWHPGEPNNAANNEHHLVLHQNGFNGTWNDEGQTTILAYMIEYEPTAPYCAPSAPNSTGVSASIGMSGTSLVANNDVVLEATGMPQNSYGLFLTSRARGLVLNPGGSQGNLCLGGTIGRFVGPGQIQHSGPTSSFSLAIDLTQHPTPTGPVSVMPGDSWKFQAWFRDAVGGVATSNFTSAIEVVFQ